MKIEIAYASLKNKQFLQSYEVSACCNIKQAIEQSGILQQYPEINLGQNAVGVFGKRAELETILKPNDRVEIYRSLLIDPKQARRLRAKKTQ